MINNTNVENKHTTNGVLATVYPITFQGAATDSGTPHLRVMLKTADGTSIRRLVYNVDYELVREEIDPTVPQTESMSVPPVVGIKLLNAEDATAGNSLTITRETPFVQDVDFQVGRIDPEQVEDTADLSVLRDQELRNQMTKDEAVIEDHEQRITTAETTIADHEERITTAEGTIANHEQRITTAEGGITTLYGHKNNLNNPHQTSIAKLTDTNIVNPTAGHFLMFDGLKWKNVNSSATASWGTIIGNITSQTDLMNKFSDYVRKDGTSIMTGALKMRATSSFLCAIAPYWDGVGFFKLNDNNSVTLMASIEYQDSFAPAENNVYNIGSTSKKWKNLYLAGKAYMSVINNGYDIAIPVTNSADTLALVNADIAPLQQQINHLQTIGRFLSFWDATTGLAQTNPQTSPYVYQTGDYFRVGVVASGGGTNYKPTGSSYTTGVASTVVETNPLTVGQVYYYDGTNWALAAGGSIAIDGTTIVFNSDNEIQAVATVNQNTATGTTNPIYNWVGTLAEYNAQNIATLHPDWICYITDDVSGGVTGHEVIAFQAPTAENNYTWYRKYADGWVEQGNCNGVVSNTTVNLPVTMLDSNYSVLVTSVNTTSSPGPKSVLVFSKTTTSFGAQNGGGALIVWEVKGMAA